RTRSLRAQRTGVTTACPPAAAAQECERAGPGLSHPFRGKTPACARIPPVHGGAPCARAKNAVVEVPLNTGRHWPKEPMFVVGEACRASPRKSENTGVCVPLPLA